MQSKTGRSSCGAVSSPSRTKTRAAYLRGQRRGPQQQQQHQQQVCTLHTPSRCADPLRSSSPATAEAAAASPPDVWQRVFKCCEELQHSIGEQQTKRPVHLQPCMPPEGTEPPDAFCLAAAAEALAAAPTVALKAG